MQQQQQPKPQVPPQQLTKTATIRNSVNLKKSSLSVKPVPGNPHELRICFTFDASAPCRRVRPAERYDKRMLLHPGCLGPHITDVPGTLTTAPAPASASRSAASVAARNSPSRRWAGLAYHLHHPPSRYVPQHRCHALVARTAGFPPSWQQRRTPPRAAALPAPAVRGRTPSSTTRGYALAARPIKSPQHRCAPSKMTFESDCSQVEIWGVGVFLTGSLANHR